MPTPTNISLEFEDMAGDEITLEPMTAYTVHRTVIEISSDHAGELVDYIMTLTVAPGIYSPNQSSTQGINYVD